MLEPTRDPDLEGEIGPYEYHAYEVDPLIGSAYVKVWLWKNGRLVRSVDPAGPRTRLRNYHTRPTLEKAREMVLRRLRKDRIPGSCLPTRHPRHEHKQNERKAKREALRQRYDVRTERMGGKTFNWLADPQ